MTKAPREILAAVCHEFAQPLRLETVRLAAPQEEEVQVDLEVCAICHSDLMAIDGHWNVSLPGVFGHEAIGRVSAVGEAVSGLAVGDRVVLSLIRYCGRCYFCQSGDLSFCEAEFNLARNSPLSLADGTPLTQGTKVGAFAEMAVVHQSQCIKVDAEISGEVACTLSCGVMTGIGAVTRTSPVAPATPVVVIGAGGVGINCIQGAALAGAYPVIALDVREEKLDKARQFGASHCLRADLDQLQLVAEVKRLTQGRGADIAFVAVGASAAIEGAVDLVRNGGKVVVAGIPAHSEVVKFASRTFGGRGVSIVGSKMGSARPHLDVPRLIDLYRSGKLDLDGLVAQRFALKQINEALDAARSGASLKNLIVLGGAQ
ncbi:MAG: alcohol dehydrogenase catalytic domain-containing protein [Kiloniellales bacterium]